MDKKSEKGTIIGLEVGADSFRVVKAVKNDNKIRVLDFAHFSPLIKQNIAGETSVDMSQQLVSIVGAKEMRKANIRCTIPCSNVCIRVVSMPVMPHQELYQAIRSKIHKYFSGNLDEAHYNFSVIGESDDRGTKKLDVIFAAIPKQAFNKYFQKFESLGMKPRLITPACFASWSMVRFAGLSKDAATMMLINIDSRDTDLTVCSENQFVFTRNISIGASNFSEILKEQSQLLLQKPDAVKTLWNQAPAKDVAVPLGQGTLAATGERLRAEGEMLRKEIELTAHHHYQSTHGGKVDKCIVFGEGVHVAGLVDFLQAKTEVPLVGFSLPETITVPTEREREFKENAAEYIHALGAVVSSPEAINLAAALVPQPKKGIYTAKLSTASKIPMVIIAVFIAIPLSAFLLLEGFNIFYKHQIENYGNRQQKIQEVTLQVMNIKRAMDVLESKKKLYDFLLKRYPSYSSLIMEICKAMPNESIVLDDIAISGDAASSQSFDEQIISALNFTLAGRIVGEGAQSALATAFVLELEKSGHFENISIKIDEPAAKEGLSIKELGFVISGTIGLSK